MPCDSVAIVSAKLAPDVAKEIIGNQTAVDALTKWLEVNLSERVSLARNDAYGVAFYIGNRYVAIGSTGLFVRGTSRYDAGANDLLKRLEPAFLELAQALAQERLNAQVQSLGAVVEDVRMPNGARLLTVRV